jgi:hypothetical protein
MPAPPSYIDHVPEALKALRKMNPNISIDRTEVQALLGIQPKTAQRVMATAGSHLEGKAAFITPGELALFLERWDSQERVRRKKCAQKIQLLHEDFIQNPPAHVELPNERVRVLRRYRYDALPEGVTVEPGRIEVKFSTALEAMEKMMAVAVVVSQSFEEFEAKVGA